MRAPAAAALAALLRLVAGAAAYGFAIGAGKSLLYAWRSAVKVPLLLLGTAALCACAYPITAAFLGVRLRTSELARAASSVFSATAALLASLAPVALFLGRTMERPVDRSLGGYPAFVGANMVFIAAAGTIALVHQARLLLREHRVTRARSAAVVAAWLCLSLLVGGQLAFWLRPFFGIASLTGEPPFLLGGEPTVTGARNVYEVVWQFVRGVGLG